MRRDLPTEIWIQIVSYLDGSSLRKISQVCSRWYQISNDRKMWERVCKLNGFAPLIQDLGDDGTEAIIDWKRVFIRGLRTREKNAFFDLMISRTSDQTLFNVSISQIPAEAMNISCKVGCPQCLREKEQDEEFRLDFIGSAHGSPPSRLHSILWDEGFSGSGSPGRSDFLKHTLKMGCIWAESPRVKVPKEFLLDYHTLTKSQEPIEFTLSSLTLGSSPRQPYHS